MLTDTEIKLQGVQALMASLGKVNAERFVALIQREPFDYTAWQRKLWNDQSVEEISRNAMKQRDDAHVNNFSNDNGTGQ